MPIAAVLVLIAVALICGTITYPTQEEIILLVSSSSLLVIAWVYKREKKAGTQETPKTSKENARDE